MKSAAAYPCSIAKPSQQFVVGKSTAKSYAYPSHHLAPTGQAASSAVNPAIGPPYIPANFLSQEGVARRAFTARIERPQFYRGGSASKKGTWPLSFPIFLRLFFLSKGGLDWSLTARIEGAHSDCARSASERDYPGRPAPPLTALSAGSYNHLTFLPTTG